MEILEKLGIKSLNSGASTGSHWWAETSLTSPLISSVNPTTGETIAQVRAADNAAYQRVVKEAQEAFLSWRMVPAPVRGDLIRQMGELLRTHKKTLGALVSLEMGKIRQEGEGEVQEMIDMADFAVGQSRMLYGKTMHSERPQHRMYEQWHPLGIVGVISAFNFPVAVWAWNAFLAAICGNVVLWKPAAKTPLTAIAVQHLCNRVMQDNQLKGVFSLFIPGQRELAVQMVEDHRLPLISFTGSTPAGKDVATRVAGRFGRSLLELGGNNAIIVDETADLKLAIPAIVFGAVGTAGQRCTSTRRLILHKSIADEVLQALVNAYQQVRIGNPLEENILMGPLVDQAAVEAYQTVIDAARAELGPSAILCGGKVRSGSGFFVEPTIIKTSPEWRYVQQETFVPILYAMVYETIDEAIAIQNSVPQGLSSAIFSRNLKNSERFLSALGSDCGIANVNIGTSGAEIGGAFGGEKETGGGREAGSDAWQAYMRRQTNTINWSDSLPLAQGINFVL